MKVNKVSIELEGKYNLSKLEALDFKKIHYRGERYFYRFIGIMHKYTFIPIDDNHCLITIYSKSKYIELYHKITFGNINGFVREYVNAIQIEENR